MGRPLRIDVEGAYYHVGNRGIARRTYLEKPEEYRYFKSRMAYAARRDEIRVIAFALMTTHFHILLQSRGGLSTALRRIQNEYVRRFNITHERDGPLGRGRFFSKLVDSRVSRRNVVLYLDDNPVVARMADTPEEYEWGSAHLYARENRPKWLETAWVDSLGLWLPRSRRTDVDGPAASLAGLPGRGSPGPPVPRSGSPGPSPLAPGRPPWPRPSDPPTWDPPGPPTVSEGRIPRGTAQEGPWGRACATVT